MGFKRKIEDIVRVHMKKVRWKNDKPGERALWCPLDCEEGTVDEMTEGTCYGPLIGGCIFRKRPKTTSKILRILHARREDDKKHQRPVWKALQMTRSRNWDHVLFSNAGDDVGRKNSKHFATFAYDDAQSTHSIRDMIVKAI